MVVVRGGRAKKSGMPNISVVYIRKEIRTLHGPDSGPITGVFRAAMVYISSWQEFQDAAEALYAKSPNKASAFLVILRRL